MSQTNPKYKRLESLLSDAKSVEPDPGQPPAEQGAEAQQAQVTAPEAKPSDQNADSLKVQIPEPDVKPAPLESELPATEAVTPAPEAEPVEQPVESLKVQIPEPEITPVPMEVEMPAEKVAVPEPEAKPEEQSVAPIQLESALVVVEEDKPVVEPDPVLTANKKKTDRKIFSSLFKPRPADTRKAGTPETVTASQRQVALWAAAIFTLLGVVFFIFSLYNVIIIQLGRFDPSDMLLTPVTVLMVSAGVAGFILIRRGRFMTGLWLVFTVAIIPPVTAVLVLNNVFFVASAYIGVLAFVMITRVFPKSERRKAIIATLAAVLLLVVIELWSPAFRISSQTLQAFAPFAILLALIGLIAFFVWQAAIGSIRTKLITAFVLVSLLSMGVVALFSVQNMRTSLTENIGNNLHSLARAKAAEIGQTVKRDFDVISSLAVNKAVIDAAVQANQEGFVSAAMVGTLDQQWRDADEADNNQDPLVVSVLKNPLSAELARFREQFPTHVEVFLTDKQGLNVASTNRTSDYYQGDEDWWRAAAHQGVYIGEPEFDESSGTVAINMAHAIYAPKSNELVGVLRTTVDFTTLINTLVSGQFGETGKTDIYLHSGQELELDEEEGDPRLVMEEAALDLNTFFQSSRPFVLLVHKGVQTLASQSPVTAGGEDMASRAISSLGWRVVARQAEAEALNSVNTQTRNNILLFVAITALVAVVAVFLARLITNPILDLRAVAEKVSQGDLDVEAKTTTRDEVGILAETFNTMTAQLKNLVGSLEQRVADRTHDLELASEVGRAVTEKVADLDDMLTAAAEMIRARFGLYYTQVYLTDPAGQMLLLRAGTGDVGEALLKRNHRLTVDYKSLNGRAALEKKPIIVADTLSNPNFKPNPLLPKTRSEMAVPLISGDRVLGVLDMQSEHAGTLSDANVPAFEALAGQLAIAVQNSELFAETERARAESESQAKRLTRSGWIDYMDAIHRPEYTGFVYSQNQIVEVQTAELAQSDKTNALSLPLQVTGEAIGMISVELEDNAWTDQRKELVQNVARQVSQQVENLRLLETAERYRAEAEGIMRRLTHEGWDSYTSSMDGTALSFAYDSGEVVPLVAEISKNGNKALAVPLSVREEAIGQLAVDKSSYSEEAHEIMQAVASQLSSHIENLRLSEQNEKRAAELEAAVVRLRELDRLKSSFLANMSHELRTPLNSILGFADVMLEELDGPLTPNMQNDLGLIQKNGQHLLHLINDVLDMAKIEAGRMNLNPETFRVHEILDEVTSITSTLASEKNLSLFIESDSNRRVEIYADRTRLRQVMINLVNNAIKFTDKGKISVSAAHVGDHVLISVKDTGIGIPVDKLEEVFTEFAQVDTSTTRKAGGTGLGLPISRKLIEMHGGRLWAESSGVAGEGSTFFVELPLEAQLAEPVEKLERLN